MTGRFGRLNAQIGAYETYDDALFGVKAFHGGEPAARDEEATAELRRALGGLQALEDALPYAAAQARARGHPGRRLRGHRRLRPGARDEHRHHPAQRAAALAPLRPHHPLRENIMKHPRPLRRATCACGARRWRRRTRATSAARATSSARCGTRSATTSGVERDSEGRTLDVALQEYADALEEMKSDLVSLFALLRLGAQGAAAGGAGRGALRAVQASGIRRTLQNNRPRKDQPYQLMQLVQFNWFRSAG